MLRSIADQPSAAWSVGLKPQLQGMARLRASPLATLQQVGGGGGMAPGHRTIARYPRSGSARPFSSN